MLETKRLFLRAISKDDAEAIFEILANPRVNRYLWEPLYKNPEEVRDIIPDNYDGPNLALVIINKETGKIIGTCGIVPDDTENEWELGYCLEPKCWGCGYATEVINAFIKLARENGVKAVFGEIAVDNTKSIKTMERNGLEFYCDSILTKADGSMTFKSAIYRMKL